MDVASTSDGTREAIRTPAVALAKIRQHGFKVCVCEQPSISIHSPLFHDLAARKYLMTDAGGRPYERAAGAAPDDARPGALAGAVVGHHRFDQSSRLRVVAQRARGVVQGRRRRDQDRRWRRHSGRCDRVQWRTRASVSPTSIRCSTAVAFSMPPKSSRRRAGAAADLEQLRLERQPALSGAIERRYAKRLGGSGGEHSRQPVERHERRAVSRLRSRRRLRRRAGIGGALSALVAGRRLRLAPRASRRRRARPVGARRRAGKNRAAVAGISLPAVALPRHRRRAGGQDRHAGDARDAARVPRQCADPRPRYAVHVRRRLAGRACHRAGRRSRRRAAAGRMVRPRDPAAPGRPAGDPLPRHARPLSGVRTRRARAAARTGGAAHRRSRPRKSAERAVGVRQARACARWLHAGEHRAGRRRRDRHRDIRREGRSFRRLYRRPHRRSGLERGDECGDDRRHHRRARRHRSRSVRAACRTDLAGTAGAGRRLRASARARAKARRRRAPGAVPARPRRRRRARSKSRISPLRCRSRRAGSMPPTPGR